jgi:hypothetical protein
MWHWQRSPLVRLLDRPVHGQELRLFETRRAFVPTVIERAYTSDRRVWCSP